MKEITAYICEYCNNEMTITTNIKWLKEHELLCDKNPANTKLRPLCSDCKNSEIYRYVDYDGYHKEYMDKKGYRCTLGRENVKRTNKVCLQFTPKTK